MLTLLKAQKAISHYWSLLIAGLKECHWRLHYLMIQILSGRSIKKVMKEVLLMLRKETYRHLMKFSFLTHNPRLRIAAFLCCITSRFIYYALPWLSIIAATFSIIKLLIRNR